jgi:HTH-type transcriptional regulator/antitoxin HigA
MIRAWQIKINENSAQAALPACALTLISMGEPIEPPDPIEAVIYHMESRGLTRRDLEPYLGSRARVAEVLNRKRALSIDMIRKLHAGLGISAEVLIRPYVVKGSAA